MPAAPQGSGAGATTAAPARRDGAGGSCSKMRSGRTLKTEQRTERHAAVSTGRRTSARHLHDVSPQLLEGAGRAAE